MSRKRTAEDASLDINNGNLTAGQQLRSEDDINPDRSRALDDANDEELDRMGVPTGWRECPKVSGPLGRFLACKVPLGAHFNGVIDEKYRFTVRDAFDQAKTLLRERPITLVIDLTKSSRYYDAQAWLDLGVLYSKIELTGRGEAPTPMQVNEFFWEAYCHMKSQADPFILVHCTHGFNRTGFMIVSTLMRLQSMPEYSTLRAISDFARIRPPGIYKHYYIQQLLRYEHEALPSNYRWPSLPEWKGGDRGDQGDEGLGEDIYPLGAVAEGAKHDDILGYPVHDAEAASVVDWMMAQVMGPADEDWRRDLRFPGSQPVSLARQNIDLLKEHRYWVTWKADGTRYMIAIFSWGTFLVDRKLMVRRVNMRWPTRLGTLPPGKVPTAPVGPFHDGTLIDGEMVVDEDKTAGPTRRFLAYDLICVGHASKVDLPWGERWEMIRTELEIPRNTEREEIRRGKFRVPYRYDDEPFRFRRKDFWPLMTARKLLMEIIPKQMTHEVDGLIFQGYNDPYVCGTQNTLLKWKFAHMNSVDFRLKVTPGQDGAPDTLALELMETRRDRGPGYKTLDAGVEFPNGEDSHMFHMRIVECCWNGERQLWSFMRERRDKDLPNAYHVYEKVRDSIVDDIREENLLEELDEAMKGGVYEPDRELIAKKKSKQQP